ncbi:hypothetical protein BaRGS_00020050 [Batillaria attramentaria]|uniref:Uncharacterized protein n=1 Tax=Batillaria attramentaria TaxID=370345 RepID=A0ABD0KNE2_9CAEN
MLRFLRMNLDLCLLPPPLPHPNPPSPLSPPQPLTPPRSVPGERSGCECVMSLAVKSKSFFLRRPTQTGRNQFALCPELREIHSETNGICDSPTSIEEKFACKGHVLIWVVATCSRKGWLFCMVSRLPSPPGMLMMFVTATGDWSTSTTVV